MPARWPPIAASERPQRESLRTAPSAPRPARPARPQDIRATKEYKIAARRWTSAIVALPIVMYTSYILYERTYGEKSPKRLSQLQSEGRTSSSS